MELRRVHLRHLKVCGYKKNMESVSEIFASISVQVNPPQILDCYRLRKFKSRLTRPRPILVKLLRSIDVTAILANRWSLSSPLLIKPDMSPEERTTESTLLREWWSLIQTGNDRKKIKLAIIIYTSITNSLVR